MAYHAVQFVEIDPEALAHSFSPFPVCPGSFPHVPPREAVAKGNIKSINTRELGTFDARSKVMICPI
ncbi:hypothetical protein JCM4914_29380 [Streptomyces platensis subsp. malvinus]